jgi:hypothetical protein
MNWPAIGRGGAADCDQTISDDGVKEREALLDTQIHV